jgi:hypothetical protein
MNFTDSNLKTHCCSCVPLIVIYSSREYFSPQDTFPPQKENNKLLEGNFARGNKGLFCVASPPLSIADRPLPSREGRF